MLSRKRLYSLHAWLGLQLGLLLFIICFSGTVAVFTPEIDAWRAGRRDKARRWYRRALELSDQSYLDPNKQIADELREQLRQRLGDATSP